MCVIKKKEDEHNFLYCKMHAESEIAELTLGLPFQNEESCE